MTALPAPCEVPGTSLMLRPWRLDDVPQLEVIAGDPEISRWNPVLKPSALQWCTRRMDWSEGDQASWAVVRPTDPSVVAGAVSLHHLDLDQECSELGYWVAPDHRGAGVAKGAATLAAGFGFEVLGLRRVFLFHAIENKGSCAVAEAAGFRYEGTHRQSYRFGDDVWHDEHSHARLSSD
jgi:RimJ/RimL family protein N-acetyltransferase